MYLKFQSGLRFRYGEPMPSYRSFSDPFRASKARLRRGHQAVFWGQVRPGDAHEVSFQKNAGPGFKELTRIRTDAFGSFLYRLRPRASARYRFVYNDTTAHGSSES